MGGGASTELIKDPSQALPGRKQAMTGISPKHAVLQTPMQGPWPEGYETMSFGMGCFWGAERAFWKISGVHSTSVGYQGGHTPNPNYEEVCSGQTSHNEVVQVVFNPKDVKYATLLSTFWEAHNPTQYMQQGNDVGPQYRTANYTTTPAQQKAAEASRDTYQQELNSRGLQDKIQTEILDKDKAGPYYYAEDYHQQYLYKNPGGYCTMRGVGVPCPAEKL